MPNDLDKVPRLSVTSWLAICAAIFGLIGTGAELAVTRYKVSALEEAHNAHMLSDSARREVVDARVRGIEEAERVAENSHDHRITVLEERWNEVLTRLIRIESKQDEQHSSRKQ